MASLESDGEIATMRKSKKYEILSHQNLYRYTCTNIPYTSLPYIRHDGTTFSNLHQGTRGTKFKNEICGCCGVKNMVEAYGMLTVFKLHYATTVYIHIQGDNCSKIFSGFRPKFVSDLCIEYAEN